MSRELKLTDRNFDEEVIKSETPVLADFWASWCPPCKMVEPLIAELAEEYDGRVKVGKMNVDQNPKTAAKYGIKGLPTFILFQGGEPIGQRVGAQSKGQLREMLGAAVTSVAKSEMITAVIPAYNEEGRIGCIVKEAKKHVDEVLVIDDGSTDGTVQAAEGAGARVIANFDRKGYTGAIKTGFQEAKGEIIVTLDGDGEHDAKDIPKLIHPILRGEADLVLGQRENPMLIRPSERFLNWLTNFRVRAKDPGTGFRALKRKLALKLELEGRCTCGVFVLEAAHLGARIAEVPISLNPIDKVRKIAWYHFYQFFYVLRWLLKPAIARRR